MGGGTQPQHLLCTLPFPEPTEILDKLRVKHPSFKVTYIHLTNPNIFDVSDADIPDGEFNSHIALYSFL